jgi:hypothetical protein
MALASPAIALLTNCFANASRFEMVLRLPFSVAVIGASSSSASAVAKFFLITHMPQPI